MTPPQRFGPPTQQLSDSTTAGPRRTSRLKELLLSPRRTVLMEAHNGLSAKLAEEAGFQALWGSGLSISAALGVRDSNEASWTQVLEVLEFMADATNLPILLDGDTGYGNFNNVRRLVRKLEQRQVAGVCLEDKLFPKTNSFLQEDRQALAEIDEFCGKIRAAKDTQHDPDFVLVARTEAFIAGWGLEEALVRATAYANSGADAILVHSKRKDSADVMAFMAHWNLPVPIVIVPTKYPAEELATFEQAGVHNFIFANHSLRTVVTSLKRNLETLFKTQNLMSIENEIVPVGEIFRLQNVQELQHSEQRYLPQPEQETTGALVLAASKGDFGDLVKERPKAMLNLRGRPILGWHTETFRREGIRRIGVVRGYCKQAVDLPGLHYFDNDAHAQTGEIASLHAALSFLTGPVVITYGDILFDNAILRTLLTSEHPFTIAVDSAWRIRGRHDERRDLVISAEVGDPLVDNQVELRQIGRQVDVGQATGEWIGLLSLKGQATAILRETLQQLEHEQPSLLAHGDIPDLLQHLVERGLTVHVEHSYGHWHDLDDHKDLLAATAEVSA